MPNRAMLYCKSLILILCTLPLISFQVIPTSKTTRLFNDNLEILNGNIKQLIETEHNHTIESEYPLAWAIVTNFDKKGKVVSQKRKELWDKKWHEIKYLYKSDSNGKEIQVGIKTSEKSISTYKYGADGIIKESILYWNKSELKGKVIYKYDNWGNVVQINPTQGEYFFKTKYLYDSKQHIIKEIWHVNDKGQGFEYSIEYKSFDSKGNWLKKLKTNRFYYPLPNGQNAKLVDTIERKITYY